jgi:hypothetical protein
VAAQALKGRRAGPALGTIDRASGRARAVLFRVVHRAANRARPIWKSIATGEWIDSVTAMERSDFYVQVAEKIRGMVRSLGS